LRHGIVSQDVIVEAEELCKLVFSDQFLTGTKVYNVQAIAFRPGEKMNDMVLRVVSKDIMSKQIEPGKLGALSGDLSEQRKITIEQVDDVFARFYQFGMNNQYSGREQRFAVDLFKSPDPTVAGTEEQHKNKKPPFAHS